MTGVLSSFRARCWILLVAFLPLGCAKATEERPPEPDMAAVAQTEKPLKPTFSTEIEAKLYSPKLVMDHQSELRIEDEQRATILDVLRATQSELVEVDWQLRGEKEKLASVLSSARVNEKKALSVADGVMRLENRIKAAHLAMLVRIKNTLTEAQQSKLDEIRERGEK